MIRKILFYTLISMATLGCQEDNVETNRCSSAYSILVNDGSVLVSGWESSNGIVSTIYWVDTLRADASAFNSSVAIGEMYKPAIDELSRVTYGYKTKNGTIDIYKFNQYPEENGEIVYRKNNDILKMDTVALGYIGVLSFSNEKPYFAGSFGELVQQETGKVYMHRKPFFWDGHSNPIEMSLPEVNFFNGISTVFVDKENNYYVGGWSDMPMYWKNSEATILAKSYGEVNQIVVSGGDVYAVGLYNKYDSNSTRHTACYWKNEVYHELEDNAQAYGIYIDGEDIYIAGSTGSVPSQYKACYWKNGARVDLEDL